ncbi:MAG: hypothetical protein RIR73_2202, partial [Chloroflexota bacterium]
PRVEREEKPKPIDRTPIIVAIIGLVGTITVTLITVFANRPPQTPSSLSDENESGIISDIPEASLASSADSSCLEKYFSSVPFEYQVDIQTGISTRISSSTEGTYGVRLFENGGLLGGLQFTGVSGTNSFNVISVIDTYCKPVDKFGNLERTNANNVIGNWENLGITFATQNYRLRMGWYGENQIELIFAADP